MDKFIVIAALLLPIVAVAQEADSTDGVITPQLDESSSAGAVTWTAPISSRANLDVRTEGSFIEAVNATNTNKGFVIVNGVLFSNSDDLLSSSSGDVSLSRSTSGDPDYDKLLGTLDFGSGPNEVALAVGDGLLVPGQNYLIQVWWTDARNCCTNPRQMAIGDDMGNSVVLDSYGANRLGQYAIGLFTAKDHFQFLTLDTAGGSAFANSGNAHITAYQVRRVPFNTLDRLDLDKPSVAVQAESQQTATKVVASGDGIYDTSGNRVFYIEDSGQTREVTTSDGRTGTYREKRLFDSAGRSYTYDEKWEQIMSDGAVIMNYGYNQRQWEWVEGVTPKSSPLLADRFDKDSVRRIYKQEKGVYTIAEQGEVPILRYKDGDYINEFGEPVYYLRGSFPGWCSIILLHQYYEGVYKSEASDEIMARRAVNAELFQSENSIVIDMLKWGNNFEAKHKRPVVYFTSIEGENIVLSNQQIMNIQNQWLILNTKRWHSSYATEVPEAGFTVSERNAKKRGVENNGSKRLVLEIKVKPEFIADLQTAISN